MKQPRRIAAKSVANRLAETQSDPVFRAYDTLILDEAHVRSLNIDFLLGYLKTLLPRRPELKLT